MWPPGPWATTCPVSRWNSSRAATAATNPSSTCCATSPPISRDGTVEVVLIHDAARPLAGPDLMRAALDTARRHGGAVPAVAATGLARPRPGGGLEPLTERLVRVQTPQAFRAGPLLQAYRRAADEAFDGTDTSACVQHFTEVDVRVFPGAATNLKVTYPPDIRLAEHLLAGTVNADRR